MTLEKTKPESGKGQYVDPIPEPGLGAEEALELRLQRMGERVGKRHQHSAGLGNRGSSGPDARPGAGRQSFCLSRPNRTRGPGRCKSARQSPAVPDAGKPSTFPRDIRALAATPPRSP